MANQAGTAYIPVRPDYSKFGSELKQGLRGVKAPSSTGLLRNTGASGKKLGRKFADGFKNTAVKGFKLAGKAAIAGLATLGAGAVAFGANAIGDASDLGETLSKNVAIFGDASKATEQFGKTASEQFGLSQRAALEFTTDFGSRLQQIGELGEVESAKIAEQYTGLASDLASFNNTTTADSAAALSSALTGEFEPLKRYGVIINETILKNKALELGLYDGKGALDAQAKQLTTTAIIFEKTGKAQGDFARTSGGLANQQRILKANFENLSASIGEKLLPVAVRILTWANDKMPAALAFLESAFATIGPIITQVRNFITGLIERFRGGSADISGFGAGFIQTFTFIWETVQPIILAIQTLILSFVELIAVIWASQGDRIIAVTKTAFTIVAEVIKIALAIVTGIIQTFTAILKGDWAGAWAAVQKTLSTVWASIKKILSTALGGLLRLVRTKAVELVVYIGGLPARIKRKLGDLGNLLKNAGKAIISGLLNGFKDAWKDAADWLGGRAKAIKNLKGPIQKDRIILGPEGKAIIGGLDDGMRAEWVGVARWLSTLGAQIDVNPPDLESVGEGMIDGLLAGLESNGARVAAVAESISEAAGAAFTTGVTGLTVDATVGARPLATQLASTTETETSDKGTGNIIFEGDVTVDSPDLFVESVRRKLALV